MNVRKLSMAVVALTTGFAFGIATAKLPAPSEEQKAKAAEAKAKADEAAKREGELLGKYQDRAVERYKSGGKVVKTTIATPAKK